MATGLAVTVILCVVATLGGTTPNPCTIRIVVAGFVSAVVVVFILESATETPRAGISLNPGPPCSAVFTSGATLMAVGIGGEGDDGLDVTCKSPLLELLGGAAEKSSWESFTAVTWDLANVAIMSGVMRSIV